MPTNPQEKSTPVEDFSRGTQRRTSRFQARPGEVWNAENARFSTIAAVTKAAGYAQRANSLTTTTSTSTSSSTTTTSTSTSTSSSTSTSTSTS